MNLQDRTPIPLTEEEKLNPISKFYTTELAAPTNPAALEALLAGQRIQKLARTPYETAKILLQPGYIDGENGYCTMEDGVGYLAVNNKFPGVTLDMIKWWFAWHPLESLRYKIWDPYCAYRMRQSQMWTGEKIQNPNVAIEDKISDVVHFVCEDIGGGVQDIVIHFRSVEEIGFTKEELDKAHAWAVGGYGLVENRVGQKGKTPVIMIHYYRETEDGIESRTRFLAWISNHSGKRW